MKPTSCIYEKSGVITERDNSKCTLRLRLPGGVITPDQLRTLYETAEQYHLSDIHLTTRQTVEIPHIPDTILPDVADKLAAGGCLPGAERGEVVNVTACPGNVRCKFSNIDSLALAYEIDKDLEKHLKETFEIHPYIFNLNDLKNEVVNSANCEDLTSDEIDMCADIVVVDAFIRCKIFENPEKQQSKKELNHVLKLKKISVWVLLNILKIF